MQNNPFVSGTIVLAEEDMPCTGMAWNQHPTFAGVRMRHMITGADTQGRFSVHLVWVEPGCSLETHRHEGNWEFHTVVQGSACCELAGRTTAYAPGVCGVIPMDTPHGVTAGEGGVCILATFVPALV